MGHSTTNVHIVFGIFNAQLAQNKSPILPTYKLISSSYYRLQMPRTRDVIIPDAVKGIQEVVIKHTKTKRGTIRTTETVVPVLRPPKEKSGQSSRSKKKGKQPQIQPDDAEGSGGAIPIIDHAQNQLFTDEQEYDPPDPAPEDSQPRV
jgi:hypothetical protein